MSLVTTKEISGVECEIHADSDGQWSINVKPGEGEDSSSRNLARGEKLNNVIAQARTELKKRQRPISVRFWTFANEEGEATGVHARNRTILATVAGEREQLKYRPDALRYDTPAEVRERLLAIKVEEAALYQERKTILDEYRFDLNAAVEAALNREAEEVTA